MPRKFLIPYILILLVLVYIFLPRAVMTSKSLKIPTAVSFANEIRKEYDCIKKIKFKQLPPSFVVSLKVDNDISEEKLTELLYEVKEFIDTEEFQMEFFEEFFSIYYKDGYRNYPEAYISFDINGGGQYTFVSDYKGDDHRTDKTNHYKVWRTNLGGIVLPDTLEELESYDFLEPWEGKNE